MEKFIKFVKNNVLIILAAFFLVDFALCLFTSNPVDPTAKQLKYHTLTLDLLWALVFFEVWITSNIERLLNKRITLVAEEVNFMYDTMKKAVEESEKEKKEESTEEEEKKVE